MRLGESYRLNAETLGMTPRDEPQTTLMVPKGGVVTVVAGPNSIVAIGRLIESMSRVSLR